MAHPAKRSTSKALLVFWRDWLETLTFTGADQCHYLRPSRDQALSPCKSDRWRIFFFTVVAARPHHSQSAQAAVKGALPPPPPALSAPPSMRLPLTACFSACCAIRQIISIPRRSCCSLLLLLLVARSTTPPPPLHESSLSVERGAAVMAAVQRTATPNCGMCECGETGDCATSVLTPAN